MRQRLNCHNPTQIISLGDQGQIFLSIFYAMIIDTHFKAALKLSLAQLAELEQAPSEKSISESLTNYLSPLFHILSL